MKIAVNNIEWNLADSHFLECYYPSCKKKCPHVGTVNGGHVFVCLEHGTFFIDEDGDIDNCIEWK